VLHEFGIERVEFLFDRVELAQVAIESGAARGIEREAAQPAPVGRGEQIARRRFDESLVEHGVDAVLEACAVATEVGALGALMAQPAGFFVRDPHPRQIVATQ
jgi:hypothetical protein